jgi:tetraacyldisaccharide 4'-kinase
VRAAARAAKPVMHARLKPANLRAISGKQVLAYTGIGDPQKFYDTLATFGCWLSATQSFGDHHMFTSQDAENLLMRADSDALELVTTEKDFARLGKVEGPLGALRARTHVLPVELVFDVASDGEAIITHTLQAHDRRRLANA